MNCISAHMKVYDNKYLMIQNNLLPKELNDRLQLLVESMKEVDHHYQKLAIYKEITNLLKGQAQKEAISYIVATILQKCQQESLQISILAFLIPKPFPKSHPNLHQQLVLTIQNIILPEKNSQEISRKALEVAALLLSNPSISITVAMIQKCRNSQQFSLAFLKSANQFLVDRMSRQETPLCNLSSTLLLAFKIVQGYDKAMLELLQEALRLISLVSMVQSEGILNLLIDKSEVRISLQRMVNKKILSGYLFYLVGRLMNDSKLMNRRYQIIDAMAQNILLHLKRTLRQVQFATQMKKIQEISDDEVSKIRLRALIRGYCAFLYYFGCFVIDSDEQIEKSFVDLLFSLLEIKDYVCFDYIIRLIHKLCTKQESYTKRLDKIIMLNIIQNTLPFSCQQTDTQYLYNPSELMMLSKKGQNMETFHVSPQSSIAMDYFLKIIVENYNSVSQESESGIICQYIQDHIHSRIQNQYEYEFNTHQFMSACHLMSRVLQGISSYEVEGELLIKLKQYVISNIKWLLNLNQSCLVENRKCINFKIFDLIMIFPSLLNGNQFLQEVVGDLLIARYPETRCHLAKLIAYYIRQTGGTAQNSIHLQGEDDSSNLAMMEKLSEKILIKLREELTLRQKIQLWGLILRIWGKDKKRREQMLSIYKSWDDQQLAKYCAAKKWLKNTEGMNVNAQRIQRIIEQMEKNQSFYKDDYRLARTYI